jgi:hypothetical protein
MLPRSRRLEIVRTVASCASAVAAWLAVLRLFGVL